MSDGDKGIGIMTIVKIVLLTAGAIYLLNLLTWFAHWGVMLGSVAGVGFLMYKLGTALKKPSAQPKQLASERTYAQKLADLERQERLLDREIGVR